MFFGNGCGYYAREAKCVQWAQLAFVHKQVRAFQGAHLRVGLVCIPHESRLQVYDTWVWALGRECLEHC